MEYKLKVDWIEVDVSWFKILVTITLVWFSNVDSDNDEDYGWNGDGVKIYIYVPF